MNKKVKQQFIYKIQLRRPQLLTDGPTADEAVALQGHVTYLEQLAASSTVILAGRTQTEDPSGFGIVIFTADSEAHARSIMCDDPAIKNGVMDGELFPYKIAVLGRQMPSVVDAT